MKKMIRCTLLVLAGFVAGSLITIVIAVHLGRNLVRTILLFQETEVVAFGEEALTAYFNEPDEVALWAMSTYSERLTEFSKQRAIEEYGYAYFLIDTTEMILAHARLGNLHYRMNQPDKAKKQFNLASQMAKDTPYSSISDTEQWLEWINRLDEKIKQSYEPEP